MTAVGQDTLATRSTLEAGGRTVAYFSLDKAAAKLGDVSRLPFSLKVLLENLLRFEDGGFTVSTDDIRALIDWQKNPVAPDREIQYRPARVLLQDFTGVPCVVDLAAMRDAIAKLGGDTGKINPQVPVHLVIDHSVMTSSNGDRRASTISRRSPPARASAIRSTSRISRNASGPRPKWVAPQMAAALMKNSLRSTVALTATGAARSRSLIPTPASAPTATRR
jgi:hypothetical protein